VAAHAPQPMARVLALRDRVMRVAVRGWLAGGPLPGASDIHDAPAASESLWLRLYSAAAMAALMVFRLLFPGHVARAWRAKKSWQRSLDVVPGIAAGRDRVQIILRGRRRNPSVDQHGSLDHRGAGGLRSCATRVLGQAFQSESADGSWSASAPARRWTVRHRRPKRGHGPRSAVERSVVCDGWRQPANKEDAATGGVRIC
jgi:hypothetical protein